MNIEIILITPYIAICSIIWPSDKFVHCLTLYFYFYVFVYCISILCMHLSILCVECVCVHMLMCVHMMYVYTCGSQQLLLDVFLNSSPPYFSDLTELLRLASQGIPGLCTSISPVTGLGECIAASSFLCGDLNAGPQACAINMLPSKAISLALIFYFFPNFKWLPGWWKQ